MKHTGLLWLPQEIMKQGFEQNVVFERLSQKHQIGCIVHDWDKGRCHRENYL